MSGCRLLTRQSSSHPGMSQRRCPATSWRCGSSQHWTHPSASPPTRCSIVLHPPAVKSYTLLRVSFRGREIPRFTVLLPLMDCSAIQWSDLVSAAQICCKTLKENTMTLIEITFSKPHMSQQNIWAHGWVLIMIFPSFWDLVAKYSLPFIALRLRKKSTSSVKKHQVNPKMCRSYFQRLPHLSKSSRISLWTSKQKRISVTVQLG